MNQLSFNTNNSTNNLNIGGGVNNNNNGQQIYYINPVQPTMNIPIYTPQQTMSSIPVIIQPTPIQFIQPTPPQQPQFVIPAAGNTSTFHPFSVPQSTSLPSINPIAAMPTMPAMTSIPAMTPMPQNQYLLINHQQLQTSNAVQYVNQPQLSTNTNNTNSNSNSNIGIPPPINNPFANIITETHSHSNNNNNSNRVNGQNTTMNTPFSSKLPAMRPRLVMTHTSWSSNDSIDNPRTPLTPLTPLTPITPSTPSAAVTTASTSSRSDSDVIITPSDCGTDQDDAFWPSPASNLTLKQNQPLLSPRHAHSHTHHAVHSCNNRNCADHTHEQKRNAKKKADGASFACEICGRVFKHKSNLKTHGRIHDVDAPQCKYCGKKFARESNLKQHLRVHTNERPFKCSYCPKKFKQAHSLNDHLRTHTGERPFKCNVCNKAFAVKHNMLVHKRIHTGEKPYICTVCRKQYSSKSGLNSHKVKHKHYS